MNRAKSQTFETLLFVIVLVLVFLMTARTPLDSDMWWALRAGKETWLQQAPYTIDTLSYTYSGHLWVSHSWLFDLVLYLLFQIGHYYALSGLVALTATLTMYFIWKQLRGPALFRALIILFAVLVSAPIWTPRPQIIDLLFISILLSILFAFKTRKRNLILIFPPMMLLWANLHGGYAVGLFLIGIFIAGEILNQFLLNNTENTLSWLQIRDLIFIAILSGLVTLINPFHIELWKTTFGTLGMEANEVIQEWLAPDFQDPIFKPLLWSLLFTLVSFALYPHPSSMTDALMAAAFTFLALDARRHTGPYAVVVLPIAARNVWAGWLHLTQQWKQKSPIFWPEQRFNAIRVKISSMLSPQTAPQKERKWINLLLVGALGLFAFAKLAFVAHPAVVQSYLPTLYPKVAVEKLSQTPYDGNIFNEYNWGGYLTWFEPDVPVYIDARADFYGDVFILRWLDIVEGKQDWASLFEQYQIQAVLLMPERKLARELQQLPHWQVIYQDSQSILIIKN